MRSSKQHLGFTLIELLLVVALVSISVGVTTDILLSLIRSYNKTQAFNEVESQANFISAKLEKELRSATNILIPSAGSTDSTLMFVDKDGRRIAYSVVNKRITYTVNGTEVYNLNYLGTVDGAVVSCPNGTDCFNLKTTNPQVVIYNLNFSSPNVSGTDGEQVNISSSVVVRNTY